MIISIAAMCLGTFPNSKAQENSQTRDTTYLLSPVLVVPTQVVDETTPVAFSNITSQQIEERYSTQDIPLLLSDLPSMTFYSENGNGIGYNYLNLRGFDQRRISVMINGIPQNDPEDHNVYWIDLPDLVGSADNIQVQRGAGMAFYGPPAIGGSVNLTTNPFMKTSRVTLESTFGFQEFADSSVSLPLATKKFSATVNSGLVGGRYAAYARIGSIQSTGYRENSWVEMQSYFLAGARFDSTMTTRIHLFGGPIADGLSYGGLPKFANDDPSLRRQNLSFWISDSSSNAYAFAQRRRPQEIENFSQPHVELLHEWKLSPKTAISSTAFYYAGDGFFDYDASWVGKEFDSDGNLTADQDTTAFRVTRPHGFAPAGNLEDELVRAYVGNRQWGFLPRVERVHASGVLTVGGEFRFHRSTHWGKLQFASGLPAGFDPDFHFYEYNGKKQVIALFAREMLQPSERVVLMLDLQAVRNRYALENERYLHHEFAVEYLFLNPRAGLHYTFDDRWKGFVSVAHTTREPRLRNLYAAEDAYFGATPQFRADTSGGKVTYDFDSPLAKPERLLDIELGMSYSRAPVTLSAGLFWMEFTDELVKSGQIDIFGQPVTGNAERSRHVGMEFEGSASLTKHLSLNGNFAVSRNRLVRYVIVSNGIPLSLDGNAIAGFPDFLGNLRLTYRADRFTLSGSWKYVGSFFTDNTENDAHVNDAYAVLNGEARYRFRLPGDVGLVVRGEARNALNSFYTAGGEGESFFPAAERNYILGLILDL